MNASNLNDGDGHLQGNCGILVARVRGSGDPRRKWEKIGEPERERAREGERKVLLLFAK